MALGFAKRAVRGKVLGKAVDELAMRLADETEQAIDVVIRLRAPAIHTAVEVERLQNPQLSDRELAERMVVEKTRLVATTGALSALPGAIPGGGAAVEIAAAVADAGVLIYNQVSLIVAVSSAYGRDPH